MTSERRHYLDLDRLGLSGADPFSFDALTPDEQELFQEFPADYRAFIETYNGGLTDMESDWCFPTGMVSNADSPYDLSQSLFAEFWTFISRSTPTPPYGRPKSVLHEHFDRHLAEEFLPSGVYAIGNSAKNSLIAISINEADFGVVYYWEFYWEYPWFKPFFDLRAKAVAARFPGIKRIIDDPVHPQHRTAVDALNYATLVKAAGSFTDFTASMWQDESGDEDEDE